MWRRVSRRRISSTGSASLRDRLHSVFADSYSDRRCIGVTGTETEIKWMKYGEIWEKAEALSKSLNVCDKCVGIFGGNSENWIITDLACVIAGVVSVPVPPSISSQELGGFVNRFCIGQIVVTDSSAALKLRSVRLVDEVKLVNFATGITPSDISKRVNEPLQKFFTILTTSGTSGLPKGVPYTCESWLRSTSKIYIDTQKYPIDPTPEPAFLVRVCYQPLHHITERHQLFTTFFNGGETFVITEGFQGDDFFTLVQRVAPTVFSGTVGLFRLAIEYAARKGNVKIFGERVHTIMCGAGTLSQSDELQLAIASSPETIITGYGSTEFGNIALRFYKPQSEQVFSEDPFPLTISPDVELKQIETEQCEKSNSYTEGEAVVRRRIINDTLGEFSGYLRSAEDVRNVIFSSLDSERPDSEFSSWYATGDIVRRAVGSDNIAVVGRVSSSVKLANGTFFVPERAEKVLHYSPMIIKAIVTVSNGIPYALLQVTKEIFSDEQRHEILHREIAWVQSARGLQPLERVSRILKVFSESPAGLTGPTGSPQRKKVQNFVEDIVSTSKKNYDVLLDNKEVESLVLHFEQTLKFSSGEIYNNAALRSYSFSELGGDSLLAMRFIQKLDSEMRDKLSHPSGQQSLFEELVKCGVTLEELIIRLRKIIKYTKTQESDCTHTSLCARGRKSRSKKLKSLITEHSEVLRELTRSQPEASDSAIILTGATGFIGVHLLHEIIMNATEGTVVNCVGIRAENNTTAKHRLLDQLHRAGLDTTNMKIKINAFCGDIRAPLFGLPDEDIKTIYNSNIISIIHCAAVVNFISPVEELFHTNVTSTMHTLTFAAAFSEAQDSTIKYTFVSSTDAAKATEEGASGYAKTKLMCEQLIKDVEVNRVIARSVRFPLVGPNTVTGCCQPNDWIVRCIQGVVWSGKVPAVGTYFPGFVPVDVAVEKMFRGLPLPELTFWNWKTIQTTLSSAGYFIEVVPIEIFSEAVLSDNKNPFCLLWKPPTGNTSAGETIDDSLQSTQRCVAYLRKLAFLPPANVFRQ